MLQRVLISRTYLTLVLDKVSIHRPRRLIERGVIDRVSDSPCPCLSLFGSEGIMFTIECDKAEATRMVMIVLVSAVPFRTELF